MTWTVCVFAFARCVTRPLTDLIWGTGIPSHLVVRRLCGESLQIPECLGRWIHDPGCVRVETWSAADAKGYYGNEY